MAGPALPVEESPKARAQLGLTSGGSGWGSTAINGAASAASKHVVDASGASDVTTERVKITCPVGTYRLTLGAINGVAAHPFIVRVSIAPFDAVEADDKFCEAEVKTIFCFTIDVANRLATICLACVHGSIVAWATLAVCAEFWPAGAELAA